MRIIIEQFIKSHIRKQVFLPILDAVNFNMKTFSNKNVQLDILMMNFEGSSFIIDCYMVIYLKQLYI